MRVERLAYAQRLSAAGVRKTLFESPRQIHGFFTLGRMVDEANPAILVCGAAVQRALMPAR